MVIDKIKSWKDKVVYYEGLIWLIELGLKNFYLIINWGFVVFIEVEFEEREKNWKEKKIMEWLSLLVVILVM